MTSRAATILRFLSDDIIAAVESGNAAAVVQTPGWRPNGAATLAQVLDDAFASPSDTLLPALIALWAQALKSADQSLRLPAMAALAQLADQHVQFHSDDALAAELEAA